MEVYQIPFDLRSWVEGSHETEFPIQNLPYGIFSGGDGQRKAGVAIGRYVVDLPALFGMGAIADIIADISVLEADSLNDFIALGRDTHRKLRARLGEVLQSDDPRDMKRRADSFLLPIDSIRMHMPVEVGDYTDFYSSEDHARNVGTMFRDPDNALLPNWKHLPVGYHGRASSIVVSGTPVRRPMGQILPAGEKQPVFGASRLLDFELEVGFVVGRSNPLGSRVGTGEAEDHIFGLVLFNDWSARDIQKWEYVPLGPFLGKSFASTISPWIVTLDALAPFRVRGPVQDPKVLPYLEYGGKKHYDIRLEVQIQPQGGEAAVVSRSNFRYMYWNMAQQLAHHTVNGCNMSVGDICASGTISGPEKGSYGSMLELSWRGTKPLRLPDGSTRKFLLDGDTVIMRGYGEKDGVRIGFGECSGQVVEAKE